MNHDTTARRFAYIETQLLWGTGLTARELGLTFGIARQNAQAVLQDYRRCYPANMRYDPQSKRNVITENFTPHFIEVDPYRFLGYQRGMALAGYYHEADDWADLPFQDADRLLRPTMISEALRVLVNALRLQKAAGIVYLAKRVTGYRLISPHHLVYADNRYHLRAFCHTRQAGRDFVLSRIREATLVDSDWIPPEHDLDWNTRVTLRFVPHPDLAEKSRESLRHAWSLGEAENLSITTRRALGKYLVRRLTRADAELGIPFWVSGH